MTLDRVRFRNSAFWKKCFCSCIHHHLPAGVGVMAFDSPQEATVISLPFAHWMGMCSSASGILLASSSSEYCPGIWPVSQDSNSACQSTDPPGWTREKNERLLAESEPTASKVGTMPYCSTFFFLNIYLHPALCGSLEKMKEDR